MEEKKKCPNCDIPLIKRKVHHGIGPGGKRGELPEIETRDAYICPKCKGLFFEEDLTEENI